VEIFAVLALQELRGINSASGFMLAKKKYYIYKRQVLLKL